MSYQALLKIHGLYRVLPNFHELYRKLPNVHGFFRVSYRLNICVFFFAVCQMTPLNMTFITDPFAITVTLSEVYGEKKTKLC